jgi:hypothetical protein
MYDILPYTRRQLINILEGSIRSSLPLEGHISNFVFFIAHSCVIDCEYEYEIEN